MEYKIRTICNKRLSLQSLPSHYKVLILGPEYQQSVYVLLTLYKALLGSLETEKQVLNKIQKQEKYSQLKISDNIEINIAGNEVFEGLRERSEKESVFSYYKKKFLIKRPSDRIEANLIGSQKITTLVIVLNGNRIQQDLLVYRSIVAEFKAKGIFYPHAIITMPEYVIDKENLVEEVSIELGISRSCCHFISVYTASCWQNSIDTDLTSLTILTGILQ